VKTALARLSLLAIALVITTGCGQSGDPCDQLCDGIVRCRMGNAQCVAEGMTAREPFMTDCVAVCGDLEMGLTETEREEALECLDCLRAETNFAECNGEMLVDDTCASTCRSDGAARFRNNFYPMLWDDYGCLRNP
jgi:hypothetical protein